ncbi:MAG: YitT family protein [Bacteroidales bacterium]|nr:YitT family protein [Candidatus Colimorpha pelethequi]
MQIFQKKRAIVFSYIVITFGLALYTFAWAAFLLPAQIVGGGVSGISSILYYAAGVGIPIGVLNLVFNAILLAIGFKVLGSKFGANTIYGIIGSSLFFILWQQVLHVENLFVVEEFGNFMCAIIGGALCGMGIGMTFSMGGNSGGTDIIALICSKYYNVSPGKVIMYLDIVIIGCSYFVSHKLENVVFGYIVMVTMTYVLDMVLDGNKQSYQIMVFSAKNAEIGDTVTKEVGRGATLLDAEGCYSHKGQKVLLMLVHKTDKPHVMQIIHRIDTDAFISVSKTQGVFGKNFEKLKL